MKKILILMLAVLLIVSARAQTYYSAGCGMPDANGTWTYLFANEWQNGGWFLIWSGSTWYLNNAAYNGGASTWQSATTNLFGTWINNPSVGTYTNPPPTFYSSPYIAPVAILTNTLVNFFPTNGGSSTMLAGGVTTSNTVLIVSVNTNTVFRSNPTQTNGAIWQLVGTLTLDASNNLTTAFSMTGNGVSGSTFSAVTNVAATNIGFVISEDANYATNLTITSVQIVGQQAVGGVQPIFTWPPAFILATQYTPATASNSTFGYGAGLLAGDTNYIYVSVATNAWRRLAIPTNTW
jgi:hypothetical protein